MCFFKGCLPQILLSPFLNTLSDISHWFIDATVMKLDTKSNWQVPREIDVALDIEYSGGFIITLDVDLIFGKSASLTVKLDQLKGRLRLQFTRNPCTHWSFSFYDVCFVFTNFVTIP